MSCGRVTSSARRLRLRKSHVGGPVAVNARPLFTSAAGAWRKKPSVIFGNGGKGTTFSGSKPSENFQTHRQKLRHGY